MTVLPCHGVSSLGVGGGHWPSGVPQPVGKPSFGGSMGSARPCLPLHMDEHLQEHYFSGLVNDGEKGRRVEGGGQSRKEGTGERGKERWKEEVGR